MPDSIPSRRSVAHKQRHHAVDTCWGVPVVAALCALLVTLPATFMPLLFSFMVTDYGVSRQGASWPMNVFTMGMQLSGLLISLLQRRVSIANIIILSCCISSVGITASAFARDVIGLTITIGAIYGCGMGMFVTSVIVFNLRLFDKYKGTAVGCTFIAWAAGGFYGPALFSYLRATYSFNGALLLMGGILLHSVPLSMLLNNAAFEIPGCLRVVKKRVLAAGVRKFVVAGDHKKPISREDPSEVSPIFQGEVVSGGLKISDRIVDPVKEVLPSSDGNHISVESPVQGLKKLNNKNGIIHQDQGHKASKASTSVFKVPAFYVCMLATMVGEYSLVSFGTTIVDFAVGKGIPLNVAMNLITCASVGHLFGRLVIMPLSDLAPCSRWFLYSGSHVLEALCTLVIPRVGSAWGIIALRLAEAISQGSSAAIRAILVAQLLGIEAVAFCTGVFGVVMVPIWLTSPQIMGFFRDGMGSYDGFYGMLGGVNTAAAVVTGVFFAFNWKRLQQKRQCDYVATEQDVSASAA